MKTKNKLLILLLTAVILGIMGFAPFVSATANTVFAVGTNCSMAVTASQQMATNPVVASKFLWNVTIQINNTGDPDRQCNVSYTSYKYVDSDGVAYYADGTSPAGNKTTGTDSMSRRYWNWTSETVTGGASINEYLVFNFSTSATSQATPTQRLVYQKLQSITNGAEVTITNLNGSAVAYDSSWDDSPATDVKVWDCGTDATCGDTVGSAGGKSQITAVSYGSDTVSSFKDASVPTGTSYYGIEGAPAGGAPEDYINQPVSSTIPSGGSGSQVITQTQGQGTNWALIAGIIVVIIIILIVSVLVVTRH